MSCSCVCLLVLVIVSIVSEGIEGNPCRSDGTNDSTTILGNRNDDDNRIVGGKYAKKKEYPFMAAVHRLLGNGFIAECGGTILSSRWVLTAGHCIAKKPHRFFLVFGVIDKSGVGYDFLVGNGLSMTTTKAIVHPEYAETVNDVGLLYMPRDIPYSDNVQPIRLPFHWNDRQIETDSVTDLSAIVLGWGRDGFSKEGTKRLKYAVLPIISNSECARYWAISKRNVCTAPGLGQDACQGDSGGPLIIGDSNGQPLQIGIVSYGDAFCPSTRPGVYTRVTFFLRWIRSVTGISSTSV